MKINRTIHYTAIIVLIVGAATMPAVQAAAQGDKTSIEEVKRETRELLQSLKAYGADQRDEAIEHASAALENRDKRIEVLDQKLVDQWDQMDQAARDNARATLNSLRQQRTRVAEWYGGMKSSSVGAWGQMKQGFSSAYRALHEAWQKSEKEFSSDK
jgi:hypothetical protein